MKLHVKIFSSLLRRKSFLLVYFLVFQCIVSTAQDYLTNISNAFKQGNAKSMSVYFDNSIDLTFSDETNTYSKKQAEIILQKFFSKVEPKSFNSRRSGESKYNNSKFSIGFLSTSNGEYKVYIFFIQKGKNYYIKEMRFEK